MRNACVKERDQEPWMEKCGWNNGRQRQGQRESERESECVKMFKKKIRRSTSLLYFFFSSSSSHLVLDRRVRRGSGKASLRLSLRGGRWSAGRRGPTTPPGKERPALAACSLLTLAPLRTLPTLLPTLHAHRNRRRTAVLAAGRLPERSGVLRRPVLAAPPLHWGDRHPRRRRRLRRQLRAARAVCVGVLAAAHAAVARRHARHDEAAAGARGGRLRRSAARPRSLLVGHQGNLRALRLTRLLRRSPRLQNPPPLPALHSFAALHPELARKVRAVGSGVGVSTRVVSNFDALLVGHGAVVVCCVCVVLGLPAAAPAREEAALQPGLPPLTPLHALAAFHALQTLQAEPLLAALAIRAEKLHPTLVAAGRRLDVGRRRPVNRVVRAAVRGAERTRRRRCPLSLRLLNLHRQGGRRVARRPPEGQALRPLLLGVHGHGVALAVRVLQGEAAARPPLHRRLERVDRGVRQADTPHLDRMAVAREGELHEDFERGNVGRGRSVGERHCVQKNGVWVCVFCCVDVVRMSNQ
eukprot:Rhum_TRINITY_DN11682_c0_g1::Rhum_TRINITY_DN11682_c0_g1_i12::g.46286::m.46286